MAVKMVGEVQHDGTAGIVILESDNTDFPLAIQELQHGSARQLAIEQASRAGLADPRVNQIDQSTYSVTEDGTTLTDPKKEKIYRYRIDIGVTRRLV